MKPSRLWLAITAVLFVGWLGWLGWMVWTLRQEAAEGGGQPIILSRPQFLVASVVVTAEVKERADQPTTATVTAVHWPRNEETAKLVGRTIDVAGLGGSRGLGAAGAYILPLMGGVNDYRVAPTPASPGFPPNASKSGEPGPPRVYPSTPHTREQLEQIRSRLALEAER
jgi:hypothetical protein